MVKTPFSLISSNKYLLSYRTFHTPSPEKALLQVEGIHAYRFSNSRLAKKMGLGAMSKVKYRH